MFHLGQVARVTPCLIFYCLLSCACPTLTPILQTLSAFSPWPFSEVFLLLHNPSLSICLNKMANLDLSGFSQPALSLKYVTIVSGQRKICPENLAVFPTTSAVLRPVGVQVRNCGPFLRFLFIEFISQVEVYLVKSLINVKSEGGREIDRQTDMYKTKTYFEIIHHTIYKSCKKGQACQSWNHSK